jgi:hypothetical protein
MFEGDNHMPFLVATGTWIQGFMIWAAPVSTIGKTGAPQFRSHHHADLTEHNASFALIYKF